MSKDLQLSEDSEDEMVEYQGYLLCIDDTYGSLEVLRLQLFQYFCIPRL